MSKTFLWNLDSSFSVIVSRHGAVSAVILFILFLVPRGPLRGGDAVDAVCFSLFLAVVFFFYNY